MFMYRLRSQTHSHIYVVSVVLPASTFVFYFIELVCIIFYTSKIDFKINHFGIRVLITSLFHIFVENLPFKGIVILFCFRSHQ